MINELSERHFNFFESLKSDILDCAESYQRLKKTVVVLQVLNSWEPFPDLV